MFLGTHSPRLDEKGRIILPAKFREELASGLVLTKGQENCIYVFSARVTIPATLRSYAGLEKELVVIGAGSRAEIWDATAWQGYLAAKETAFSATDEVAIPGIG